MSELHKFMFEGLPVRGMLVRLDDAWQEMLRRRQESGGYPAAVTSLLGEMVAATSLMQSNIKFNGAVVMQIQGDGPVKLMVAEVQPDLSVRATAKVQGEVADDVLLSHMVNVNRQGRCAITLDPKDRMPGQQPYQGVVPLVDGRGRSLEKLSDVIEHYMLQSEQLDTRLVLEADDRVAAGLLIQRIPLQGEANLSGESAVRREEDQLGQNEDYNRIATLAASLQREELLKLDVETILRRLFWEEDVRRFEPLTGGRGPRFACTCSRERVSGMLRSLGEQEVASILTEQGQVEVSCDFCGTQYRFDPVDAAQVFLQAAAQPQGPSRLQ
ncbi:MAG: Hsp33 family molecular chaperone HslO [Hydrogenophaga sp.]|uniref:Hsp33 family molecular chaperone HslO n=1 Tax=Hydrogenophaga sp. TaxID=1904254 RepID=UPI002623D3F3|nr:Hsp33 family molecular chaperone HslO [Hydrogenophaga sp.]MDD3786102.1 Hsp33 family molecular chaperone HslO [Hydrogenophaga sp.]